MKGYVPVTRKINTIIISSLVIGIGVITFYFGRSLSLEISDSTSENLIRQSDILYSSIENFMLPGEAPLAVSFFNEIESRNPDYMISIRRTDGQKAFTDSRTINQVNKNLKMERFSPRTEQAEETPDPEVYDDYFTKAVSIPPVTAVFQHDEGGTVIFQIYKPLINKPKCTGCHGASHTIRGVIEIKSNITASVRQQRSTIIIAGTLFFGMVVILSLFLSQFLRSIVISPVKLIGDVCRAVTAGDFNHRVSIKNRDEIGDLGKTVNQMVAGLHERYELSKFVSSSTIQSLTRDSKGKKVPITLLFSDIRGFTSFSEKTSPEQVVELLNAVLNFQTEIIHESGGDVDKYVGDEIVAMFTGDQAPLRACTAGVKIQKELQNYSQERYGGLSVGIGINTGEVILGMIGSEARADFTVIGDNVNTASRLCDAAKREQVLINESTFTHVKDSIRFKGPYRLKVKGKDRYLRIYQVNAILSVPGKTEEPQA